MREDRENNYYNKMSYSRYMIICILIVCALIATYLYYDYSRQFRFSEVSGFYDDAFDLKILGNKNFDVYYTLDCTAPTVESIKYEGPIQITDRTPEFNEYSQREDISTGFLSTRIEMFSTDSPDPGYVVPQFSVDKCTVVRAGLFDKEGNCVQEISGTYFVGPELKKKYEDVMVVSIATEPENLFDYDDGIYVNGVDFDDYWAHFDTTGFDNEWWASYWYMWPANYRRTGRDAEREARVEILDENQNSLLSQNIGIRMQGAGSRGKLPRNIKLISREEYSGSSIFTTDLLENDADLHQYVLFGGADDNIYKINDYLVNYMEKGLNFATMEFRPCVCFLEGEYWGTYYLTEDYDEDYFQTHYNVPSDDVVIWKEGEIDEGTLDDLDLYTEMESFISENDMTVQENYEKACDMIDIDSFADYYAAQIFIGRCGDWPAGNIAAWRSRGVNLNSKYEDGKWRWMMFDVNSEKQCLDLERLEDDTIDIVKYSDPMFASLIENDAFKKLFCERLMYIENNVFSEDKVNTFFDMYYDQMLEPLCLSNMRFYSDERREEVITHAENMKSFLLERHEFIDNSIKEHFGEKYLR